MAEVGNPGQDYVPGQGGMYGDEERRYKRKQRRRLRQGTKEVRAWEERKREQSERHFPPVSSTDKGSDGECLGLCPRCGHGRFWDNRPVKRSGQAKPSSPDFRCVKCRSGLWEALY